MPTYEYRCSACKSEWEIDQSIAAPAVQACPICHAEKPTLLIGSRPSFLLKGEGWAKDGYGAKSESKKK
jgi:putative FmdB family regulatory protein